jgi:hypothetical protein
LGHLVARATYLPEDYLRLRLRFAKPRYQLIATATYLPEGYLVAIATYLRCASVHQASVSVGRVKRPISTPLRFKDSADREKTKLRLKQRRDNIPTMSTVQEIEKAIEHLPADEFFKLGEWFDDQRERLWDERIARDAQSGRLDFLIKEARAARKSGTLRPFP